MTKSDCRRMSRSEQKGVALTKELARTVSKPRILVQDAFEGALFTANACSLLENHRNLVGFKKAIGCVKI